MQAVSYYLESAAHQGLEGINYIWSNLEGIFYHARQLIRRPFCTEIEGLLSPKYTAQGQKEEIAKEDTFLLQNWSYHSLKEKIAYKAARAGIQMIIE